MAVIKQNVAVGLGTEALNRSGVNVHTRDAAGQIATGAGQNDPPKQPNSHEEEFVLAGVFSSSLRQLRILHRLKATVS